MTFGEAHRAIKRGQIGALAEAIPSTLSVDAANRFGWTLLMLVAMEGNTKIGRHFLDLGADVNALNKFGESAISLAAHKGHVEFVRLLRSFGATAEVYPHGVNIETWLRNTSELSPTKIDALLNAMN